MALLLKKMMESYVYAMKDLADKRTTDWPLITSPVPVIFIITCYLSFVLDIGPKWMKHRKPFNLDRILIFYNIIQVLFCFTQFVLVTRYLLPHGFYCLKIDYSDNALHLAKIAYTYFLMKLLDLFDTIFFVLRKRDRQITFLHVYHHALMVFMCWYGMKYIAVGQVIYIGFVNSFVHAVMYGYYLLSVYDKEYKDSAWWKKHITQLQLLQFYMIFTWLSIPLVSSSCYFPKPILFFLMPQVLAIIALFSDFYYKAYIRKRKVVTEKCN